MGEARYKVRSKSGQKSQFLKFLIWENKDMFLMQNAPRNPMVSFVFSPWAKTSSNRVLLYNVTVIRNVVEINLAFGDKKLMYQFETLHCGWHRLVV